MTGSRAANGTTTTSAVRSVPASSVPSPVRSVAVARLDRAGRIAVASDTVMTECGTIMMRKAAEYTE
jgi:hypothetical protein